ncbi:unnamed protein product [Phytophthora fragariaefolia]|uniref:Unnamed protein product n=1 Tax=Phytophthora fragariaefolia TaxID=1490495 RepID=A0A9W6YAC1_9STRA|nr:unnamed protein product [Phytophthora fragariaefolia]
MYGLVLRLGESTSSSDARYGSPAAFSAQERYVHTTDRNDDDRNDDDRNDDGPGSDRLGADIWAHGRIEIDSAQSFRYTIRSRFIGYQHFDTSIDAPDEWCMAQEPANSGPVGKPEHVINFRDSRSTTATSDFLVMGQSEKGWYHKKKLWIPSQCNDLRQRLMVIAHCGAQGHRGRAAMMEQLQRQFHMDHLRSKVDRFLASCLLCMHVKGGKIVQRPWSETFRCHEQNGALHWDFLIVGESFGDDTYLLVLKDHATHYCELVPCATPTSAVAVASILDWHGRFGIPPIWISDQGTHFKNEVLSEVCKRLKSEQRFTGGHSPWVNGSIERVNRDVIQVLRVMCLDYKKDIRDWTMFVPLLKASINHTPLPSLGNKAPVELFCALPLPSPLDLCVDLEQKEY